jgi:hypothetical protein
MLSPSLSNQSSNQYPNPYPTQYANQYSNKFNIINNQEETNLFKNQSNEKLPTGQRIFKYT